MAQKVQHFVNNCQMCIRTKACRDKNLWSALKQVNDTYIGAEDIFEVDINGELPHWNGYTHTVTATIPIRRLDTTSIVTTILTQHASVPQQISTDNCSAFTSKVPTRLMETADNKTVQATLKHVETNGMIEQSHQKLTQILKINVARDAPYWHR